jgi:hypothetical protein
VERLCTASIWLEHGRVAYMGDSTEAIAAYLSASSEASTEAMQTERARLDFSVTSGDGRPNVGFVGHSVVFTIDLALDRALTHGAIGIGINAATGERLLTLNTSYQLSETLSARRRVRLRVEWPHCILCPGTYRIACGLEDDGKLLAVWEQAGELLVLESDYFQTGHLPDPRHQGRIVTKANWKIEECV